MKTIQTLPLVAAFASSAFAATWFPSCAWNDCLSSYNGTTCSSSTGWECLCTDSSAIDTLNSCVATACSNSTGQEAIYAAVAQVCANAGKTVTAAPEATFSATSGGSAWPSGWSTWGGAPWYSAISSAMPGAPSGWSSGAPWGGPGAGYRGPGVSGWGPCSWSTWSMTGTWGPGETGSPWGGHGGPPGGPGGWGGDAPWTSFTGTWTDCSSTMATATPSSGVSTVTTTINGQVVTGTTFQGQAVASATGTSTPSSSASAPSDSATGSSSGASSLKGMGAFGALAIALIGTFMAL